MKLLVAVLICCLAGSMASPMFPGFDQVTKFFQPMVQQAQQMMESSAADWPAKFQEAIEKSIAPGMAMGEQMKTMMEEFAQKAQELPAQSAELQEMAKKIAEMKDKMGAQG